MEPVKPAFYSLDNFQPIPMTTHYGKVSKFMKGTLNHKYLLNHKWFIKVIAMANLKNAPLTDKEDVNYDVRVIAKSLKYCSKFNPNAAQKYFKLALASLGKEDENTETAFQCVAFAEALVKADKMKALKFAMKAYHFLKNLSDSELKGLDRKSTRLNSSHDV
jgi:hypothetical protein